MNRLAYSNVNKHKEAIESLNKAIELEPNNESYKSNLKLANDKMQGQGGASPGPMPFGMPGMGGGMDLGAMLNNPALMNMAQNMMQDPNMQNMMSQMMSGMNLPGEGTGMENLLHA